MPTTVATPFPIRTATPDDLGRFLAPLEPAFAEEFPPDELEADSHLFEPERIIAAFDGERAVGCAGAYSVRLTVPEGDVPAAAVTLVAVLPSHRRRGILSSLMRNQLDDVRRRGEPVAILWASEGAIYQRFGYGLATYACSFEIDPRRAAFLAPVVPRGELRYVDADEALAILPGIYDRAHRSIPGAISRSESWWRWGTLRDYAVPRQESGMKRYVVLEVDGIPAGYVIYRARAQWEDRGPEGRLTALEVVGVDADAERRLWRWLLDIDLVGRLRSLRQPLPPPLLHMLAEPRRLGVTVADGLWLRVVDLPGALEARGYGGVGALVLEVADAMCPWNDGRWRLDTGGPSAPDGSDPSAARARHAATIERTTDEPDLRLGAADLGAAYLGGVRFAELAAAGRVVEARPGSLVLADRLFASDRAPWCLTMF